MLDGQHSFNVPNFITISADGNSAYVINSGNNTISIIDTNPYDAEGYNTVTGVVQGSFTGVASLAFGGFAQPLPVAYPAGVNAVQNTAISSQTSTITLTGIPNAEASVTFSIIDGPTNGTIISGPTVVDGTTSTVVYQSNTNYFGLDSFTFVANNGTANSFQATAQILVQPQSTTVYSCNPGGNAVNIIEVATGAVVGTVNNDQYPFNIPFASAVLIDGTKAYVCNINSGTVSVINTQTNTVTGYIVNSSSQTYQFNQPHSVAFSPDGTKAYIASQYGNGQENGFVAVVDVSTNQVTATIENSWNPTSLAFSPDGAIAYVCDYTGNSVTAIDVQTDTIIGLISNANFNNPYSATFCPDGSTAYVCNSSNGTISIIDVATQSVSGIVADPDEYGLQNPKYMVFSADGLSLYVTDGVGYVYLIQNDAIQYNVNDSYNTISNPESIGISADGSTLYVGNLNNDSISIISVATNTVVDSIANVQAPYSMNFFGINGAPIALPVGSSTTVNQPVTITLSGTDPNGQSLVFNIVSGPIGGLSDLTQTSDTTLTALYAPVSGFLGTDSFTYTVTNTDGLVSFAAPVYITTSYAQTKAYIVDNAQASDDSYNVTIISLADNSVVGNVNQDVALFMQPTAAALTPDNTRVYVTNYNEASSNVLMINTLTDAVETVVQDSLNRIHDPVDIAISPDGTKAYVVNKFAQDGSNLASVVIIDTDKTSGTYNQVIGTVLDPWQTFNKPQSIAITPDGTKAYVTGEFNASISIIDLTKSPAAVVGVVANTFGTISQPYGISIAPNGAVAYATDWGYVSGWGSARVNVIDVGTNSVVAVIIDMQTGFSQPAAVAFTQDSSTAYVTDVDNSFVAKIDVATNSITGHINDSGNTFVYPYAIALLQASQNGLVSNIYRGTGISPIDLQNQTAGAFITDNYILDPIDIVLLGVPETPTAYPITDNVIQNAISIIPLLGSDPASNPLSYAIATYATHGDVSIPNPSIAQAIYSAIGSSYLGTDSFTYTVNNGFDDSSPATVSLNVVLPSVKAYAANGAGTSIGIIDVANGKEVETVYDPSNLINQPNVLQATPDGSIVYAVLSGSNQVVSINTLTNSVTGLVASPDQGFNVPSDAAFFTNVNTETLQALIINRGATPVSISIVDVENNQYLGDVANPNFTNSLSIAITPDNTRAYVTNDSSVSYIDLTANPIATCGSSEDLFSNANYIAISLNGLLAYVIDQSTSISVMDIDQLSPNYGTRIAIISGFAGPQQIAFTPDGLYAYVTIANNSVKIIDVATNNVVGTVIDSQETFSSPTSITMSADGYTAYVANTGNNTISIIDTNPAHTGLGGTYNHVVGMVQGSFNGLDSVAFLGANGIPTANPTGVQMVINITASPTSATIDLNATSPFGAPLTFSIVDEPAHGTAEIADPTVGSVVYTPTPGFIGTDSFTYKAHNTDTNVDSLPALVTIVVAPQSTLAYVANAAYNNSGGPNGTGFISVVDVATGGVIGTVSDPEGDIFCPQGIAQTFDGTKVLVCNSGYENGDPNNIVIIDTATNAVSVAMYHGTSEGGSINAPAYIAVAPDDAYAYFSNYADNAIGILDINAQTANTTLSDPYNLVTGSGSNLIISPDGTKMYIILYTSLLVVDLASQTITGTVSDPDSTLGSCYGAAFSPDGSLVYVCNFNNNSISVIDVATNSVTATITGALYEPNFVVFSPDGSTAYVTNYASYNDQYSISIIDVASNSVSNTIYDPSGNYLNQPDIASISADGSLLYITNNSGGSISQGFTSVFKTSENSLSLLNNSPMNYAWNNPYYSVFFGGLLAYPGGAQGVQNSVIDVTLQCITPDGNIYPTFNIGNPSHGTVVQVDDNEPYVRYVQYTPDEGYIGSDSFTYTITDSVSGKTSSPALVSLIVSPSSTLAYVLNEDSGPNGAGFISMVDVATGNQLGAVSDSNGYLNYPQGMAATFDGSKVLVCNPGLQTDIAIIDTATNAITTQVEDRAGCMNYPSNIVITPDDSMAFFSNDGDFSIGIILLIASPIQTSGTVSDPQALVQNSNSTFIISPNGTKIYLIGGVGVVILDVATQTIIGTVADQNGTLQGPTAGAFSPDGSLAYICNPNNNMISVIDVATDAVVNVITGIEKPNFVVFSPDGIKAYVLSANVGGVYFLTILNVLSGSIMNEIQDDGTYLNNPQELSISADGTLLYITNFAGGQGAGFTSVYNVLTQSFSLLTGTWNYPYSSVFLNGTIIPTALPITDNAIQGVVSVIPLLGSDQYNLPLTYSLVSQATHGTVSIPNASIAQATYSALESMYLGPDSFTYKVNNGFDDSSPATVSLNVVLPSVKAYATNRTGGSGTGSVSVINVATGQELGTVYDPSSLIYHPIVLQATPDGSKVYVCDQNDTVIAIDALTNSVNQAVTGTTFSSPFAVAFTPDGTKALIPNVGSNIVSIIDVLANAWIADVETTGFSDFNEPIDVAITPDGTRAYVANYGGAGGFVSVVDLTADPIAVVATISEFNGSDYIAIAPNGLIAYVLNSQNNTISVVDTNPANIGTTYNTIIHTISGFNAPLGIAFTPDSFTAYVVNANSPGFVSIIDVATSAVTGTVTDTQSTIINPNSIAISADGYTAYVSNSQNSTISIIDINPAHEGTTYNSVTGLVQGTFSQLGSLAFLGANGIPFASPAGVQTVVGAPDITITLTGIDPNGNALSFSIVDGPTNGTLGSISTPVQDGNTSTATVVYTPNSFAFIGADLFTYKVNNGTTDSLPALASIIIAPKSSFAYIANYEGGFEDAGYLSVVNVATGSVIGSIPDPNYYLEHPEGMAQSFDGSFVVVCAYPGIAIINTSTQEVINVADTASVMNEPYIPVVTLDNSIAFFSNYSSNQIGIIDLAGDPIQTIGYVADPYNLLREGSFIALSPDGTKIYSTAVSDYVAVIDVQTQTVTGLVSDPDQTFSDTQNVAFSPDGSKAYVSNFDSNSISVINVATDTVTSVITGAMYNPEWIVFAPDGSKAYVANFASYNDQYSITVIDATTDSVDTTIYDASGNYINTPYALSISADGSLMYINNTSGGQQNTGFVSILQTSDNSLSLVNGSFVYPYFSVFVGGLAALPTGAQVLENTAALNTSVTITLQGENYDGSLLEFGFSSYPNTANGTLSNFTLINATTATIDYTPNLQYVGPDSFTFTVTNATQNSDPALVSLQVLPPSTKAYVMDTDGGVSILDVYTGTSYGTVDPQGMAFGTPYCGVVTPDSTRCYITNNDGFVSVVNTALNQVAAVITDESFSNPSSIAICPDGNLVYVVNNAGNTLSVIDTNPAHNQTYNTVIAVVSGNSYGSLSAPNAIAVSPDGTTAYVVNSEGSNVITVIDLTQSPAAISGTIINGGNNNGLGIAVAPDGSKAYVPYQGGIGIIDVRAQAYVGSVIDNTGFGLSGSAEIAFTPDGSKAYVVSASDVAHTVSVIDVTTDTATAVDNNGFTVLSSTIAITSDGLYAYISNESNASYRSAINIVDLTRNQIISEITDYSIAYPYGIVFMQALPVANTPAATDILANSQSNQIQLTGTDQDGNALTFALYDGQPAHGTVSIDAFTGMAIYNTSIQNPPYEGPDSFEFTVNNGSATSSPAIVALSIVNAVALPAAATVVENQSTPTTITLSAQLAGDYSFTVPGFPDTAEGGILSNLTQVAPNIATVEYVPAVGYFGQDSFTYTVSNGSLDSSPATVSLQVLLPTNKAYVASGREGIISIIDVATGNQVGTVTNNSGTQMQAISSMAVSPDGTVAYVADYSGNLFVIDTALDVINPDGLVHGITSVNYISSIAFTPNSQYAVAADPGDSLYYIVQVSDHTVVSSGTVDSAISVAITPDGSTAYLVAGDGVLIVDIPSGNISGSVATGSYPFDAPQVIAISPNGNLAYVGNSNGTSLSIIDLKQIPATVIGYVDTQNGMYPFNSSVAIAFSSDGSTAYISNENSYDGDVYKINVVDVYANTVSGYVTDLDPATFNAAYSIAISADGSLAYVANIIGNSVSIINTQTNAVTGILQGTFDVPFAVVMMGINNIAVANSQTVTVGGAEPVVINLSGTGQAALTFAIPGGLSTAHGTLSDFDPSTGAVTYTPNNGYTGIDSFQFTVTDGITISLPATVTLSIGDVPVANSQTTAAFHQGSSNNLITITGSDPLSLVPLVFNTPGSTSQGGSLVATGVFSSTSRQYYYTPGLGFYGTDSFTFTVTNTDSITSASATVTIPVQGESPTATPQSVGFASNSADNSIQLAGTGSGLTFALVSGPSHGSLPIFNTATGAVTYTPTAGYVGSDSFRFRVVDTFGQQSSPATVSIAVENLVVTASQNVGILQNRSKTISLGLQGGTAPYTFNLVQSPAQGAVSGFNQTLGTILYMPTSGVTGSDEFQFTITDSYGLVSQTGTVNIHIGSVVVTSNQSVGVLKNSAQTISLGVSGGLPPYAFNLVQSPAHGIVSGFNSISGTILYTPNRDAVGTDTFQFTVTDSMSAVSQTGTVNIDIKTVVVVNPMQIIGVVQNSPQTIWLGIAGGGAPYTFNLVQQPIQGTVSGFNPISGSVLYTPNTGSVGTDTFKFTVTDSGSNTSQEGTVSTYIEQVIVPATQTISIAQNSSIYFALGISGGVAPYTLQAVVPPQNGTVSGFNPTIGTISYTPHANFTGVDSFEFTVTDHIGVVSSTGSVSIYVENIIVAQEQTVEVVKNSPVTVSLGISGGIPPYVYQGISAPRNGTLSGFNGTTGTIIYTPNNGFTGPDSFEFTVTDSLGYSSSTGLVNFDVETVVVTLNQTAAVVVNTAEIIHLGSLGGIPPYTFTTVSDPTHGILSDFDGTAGTILYTPNDPSFTGLDRFQFYITDSTGVTRAGNASYTRAGRSGVRTPTTNNSATGNVYINVTPVTPIANPQTVNVLKNITTTITLTGFDQASDPLTFAAPVIIGQPANGTLNLIDRPTSSSARYSYLPNNNFTGSDSFTFTVTDTVSGQTSAPATVTIYVTDAPVPVAQDQTAYTVIDTPIGINLYGSDSANNQMTFVIQNQPTHGTVQSLTVSGTGHAVANYVSSTGYHGTDTFTFTVSNSFGQTSSQATVTITIKDITIPAGQQAVGNMISKYHQILTQQ